MFWFILFVVVVLVFVGYKRSNAKTFFYYGPERNKYDDAFIGVLTKY